MMFKTKRIVIAFLIAVMMLFVFSSCRKEGVPGTYEDVLNNSALDMKEKLNIKGSVKLDKIPVIYVEEIEENTKFQLTIIGYIAPTEEEKKEPEHNKGTLYFIAYDLTKEEFKYLRSLNGDKYRAKYPFTDELISESNKIITKSNPSKVWDKKVVHEHRTMPISEFLDHLEDDNYDNGEQ